MMVSFMPKLWIFNIDEVVPVNDPSYSSVFVPKIMEIFPRFFLSLSPGDKIITPVLPDDIFIDYVSKILNLGNKKEWIFKLNNITSPYSLVDSILNDMQVMDDIKKLDREKFEMEGFIETPKLLELSKKTGIKLNKTDEKLISEGFTLNMNDKAYFKETAKKIGIDVVDGYIASDIEEAIEGIKKIHNNYKSDVMVKKSLYGGGFGNLFGSIDRVISELSDFISNSKIVIEPLLDLKKVYGSLAVISDKIYFAGVDEQYFCDGKWAGFDYPSLDSQNSDKIKYYTLKLSDFLFKKGVKGYVNIDWIVTQKNPDRPLALELNLRNNGFNYAVDFAKRYFNSDYGGIFIKYRENYNTNGLTSDQLINFFKNKKGSEFFIDLPGMNEGFVLMNPPSNGKAAVGIFSDKKDNIKKISEMIEVL